MEIGVSHITDLLEGKPLDGFPLQIANYAEIWCFICCKPGQAVEQKSNCRWFDTSWGSCDVAMSFEATAKYDGRHQSTQIWIKHHKHLLLHTSDSQTPSVLLRSPGRTSLQVPSEQLLSLAVKWQGVVSRLMASLGNKELSFLYSACMCFYVLTYISFTQNVSSWG